MKLQESVFFFGCSKIGSHFDIGFFWLFGCLVGWRWCVHWLVSCTGKLITSALESGVYCRSRFVYAENDGKFGDFGFCPFLSSSIGRLCWLLSKVVWGASLLFIFGVLRKKKNLRLEKKMKMTHSKVVRLSKLINRRIWDLEKKMIHTLDQFTHNFGIEL